MGYEALHGELYIWFEVLNTMCISTCHVEFVLKLYIFYYRGVDFSDFSGEFSVLKTTVLHIIKMF